MTQTATTKKQPEMAETKEMTDSQKVALYLKKNPDVLKKFILEHPDVIKKLSFPSQNAKGVSDFYAFRAQKLEKELAHLKQRNKLLIQTSSDNLESQEKIHQLALDILNVQSIKHLLKLLRTYLSEQMDVDYTHLCLLEGSPLPQKLFAEHEVVSESTCRAIFENPEDIVVLRTLYEDEDKKIHREWAEHAQSDGLLKISTPSGHMVGFLALVSGERDRFHPGQGADLLNFIARIIGHVMEGWITEQPRTAQKTG